jgi:hypothetical protein
MTGWAARALALPVDVARMMEIQSVTSTCVIWTPQAVAEQRGRGRAVARLRLLRVLVVERTRRVGSGGPERCADRCGGEGAAPMFVAGTRVLPPLENPAALPRLNARIQQRTGAAANDDTAD